MDVNSKQEKTRENISKLQKATKEVKAYKAREDLAQTVTMLNRGRLAAPRESDPKNSKQKFVAGRAWSSLTENNCKRDSTKDPATYLWDERVPRYCNAQEINILS